MSLNKTKIEWVVNPDGAQGYTYNPTSGCLHFCDYCYARAIAQRWESSNFYPRIHPDRLDDLNKNALFPQPKTIFIGSMGDQFGSWQIGEGWLNTVQKIIMQNNAIREAKKYPLNTFVFLTKNPQGYRYVDASLLKSTNCWFGITLENFGSDEKNILRASQFAKLINMLRLQNTFISLEPLLEALIINDDVIQLLMDVQWVIFGALNIKGKPTPPKGDANVGGIIDKLLMINPKLFLKDSILKMEGIYWRTNMRDFYKKIRYVPWRV